ncbi:MAG: NADH-quinone oxidoreductase subunit L [Chloroflexi bacterium]|nr:NADH-quinone oxidoreductase subunit L [Chloroflexota bacterium]
MHLAYLIPTLSAAAFVIVAFGGRWLPMRGAFVSIAAMAAGLALALYALFDLNGSGAEFAAYSVNWLTAGGATIGWGAHIDRLAVVMLLLVTFVALLVQIYSLEYMRGDSRFGWYFAVHSLFGAAMLALVLADNLLFLYIAWELVGLGSYLLIGFWWERRSAAEAAKKAFITTRIGDVGLLIGIILLYRATGTFDISDIIAAAQSGAIGQSTLTASALLLFMGAMGKSAQFPFHVWLPDAMEGPTPVSALIHAATMVAAGVYLVARMLPMFELLPIVMLVVAVVGLVTFLFAGTLALVMTDIKRALAYSTISHLGLMMLSLGAFGLAAAMFHLVAHGVSKAMLFLGAGSVMHGLDEETDMRRMGGLRRAMPLTALTFLIGALSLAGIAPLSGFFSKDEVLIAVMEHRSPAFLALTLAGVALSALYMARMVWLTFYGSPRSADAERAHESPALMTAPLLLLAVLAVTLGIVAIDWSAFSAASYNGFAYWLTAGHEKFHIVIWLTVASLAPALGGIAVGWHIYGRRARSADEYAAQPHHAIASRFPSVHRILLNKYYMDDMYQWLIDRVALAFSRVVALFDRAVVNDRAVDGPAHAARLTGWWLRLTQTGRLQNYGAAMATGAVVITLAWWIFLT